MEFWGPAIVDGARAAKRKATSSSTEALFELRQVERAVQAATRALVQQALSQGHTWQEIGAAIGTSRQAAHDRYGDLDSPSSRRKVRQNRKHG